MDHVLARFADLGTKSSKVSSDMKKVLRQRVEDRLDFEQVDYELVSNTYARIICEGVSDSEEAAEYIAELPGVASASPAVKTDCSIEHIREVVDEFEVGETFGVNANSVKEDLGSQEIERKIGSHVLDNSSSEVDLDDPDTEIFIDVRKQDTFIYTKKFGGAHGFPVGANDSLAALISGGLDSPVAAYEVMKKGSDIVPIYFYNKPVAAEDHLIRFLAVIEKLKRINPAKDWKTFIVDMEEINEELLENIGTGRMIIHRRIMFKVAEHIAEEEGLKGIVTGESMGQKSSQTPSNLELTSEAVKKPVHRPLLAENKHEIVEKSKNLGTFEEAKIDSACETLAPDSPATKMSENKIRKIEDEINVEELVENAVENIELKEV